MKKRRIFSSTLCVVLALCMVVDFSIFEAAPAHALDTKSAVIGGVAGAAVGAGVVLAAPTIAGAVGAAGGAAGIGTAVCGGVAAAAGGFVGVLGAIGGAIASGLGAVAGWIAGIVASPLFIPALVIIGAVAIGIYLYKRHKKAKAASDEVLPGSNEIMITPSDYDVSPVIPPMNQTSVTIGDDDGLIVIPGADVQVTASPVSIDTSPDESTAVSTPQTTTPTTTTTTTTTTTSTTSVDSAALKSAHSRYIAAYNKYTQLVTTSGGSAAEIQSALNEYRSAYQEYIQLKQINNSK